MQKEEAALMAAGCEKNDAALILMACSFAIHQIAEVGSLSMHALIRFENEDGQLNVTALAGNVAEEQKDLYMESVRYLAYLQGSDAVAIVAETWNQPVGVTMEEMEELIAKYGSIGNMPDRTEGVMVGLNTDKGRYMVTYNLIRAADGQISEIKLDRIQTEKDGKLMGRFFQTLYTPEDKMDPRFEDRLKYASVLVTDAQSKQGAAPDASGKGGPSVH